MNSTCESCSADIEDGTLCSTCTRTLRARLRRLPWLVEQVEATRVGQSEFGNTAHVGRYRPEDDDRPSLGEQSPIPWNEAAAKLLGRMRRTLTPWTVIVERARRERYMPTGYIPSTFIGPLLPTQRRYPAGRPTTIGEMVTWLEYRVSTIAMLPGAGKLSQDIEGLCRRAERVINRPVEPAYRGPCPHCSAALYGRREDEDVQCRVCLRRFQWSQLSGQLADETELYRWTSTQILTLMRELGETISKSTLYNWISAGKLANAGFLQKDRIIEVGVNEIGVDPNVWLREHGVGSRSVPVYRLDEVRALWATPKRQRKVGV